ncbi:cupin domain-containing protein [Streptomyces sp. NPDC058301]|uniref:cupin domain-containing protein n=1 Tax=Streptomyces sp. NPDC058301 TaxID=3346436 RepID=UPI0036E4C819
MVIVPYLRGHGTTRFLSERTFRNAQQTGTSAKPPSSAPPRPSTTPTMRPFTGAYGHRTLKGIGHNLPQEAPAAFAVPLSRRPGGVHAFKMITPARPVPLEPTPQTHEGVEWLYVLNGRLRLVIGERDLTLPPGEAAEFDTSLPHWLGSADGGAVELLILFGLQGVRAHVRTDPDRSSRTESQRGTR